MKCEICKGKTNWDSSYGYREFIVCPKCHDKIYNYTKDFTTTMGIIFLLGDLRKGEEK